jgi:hypothetical protein
MMLRRLTDAIVCAVLLVLDILAWLIVSTFSSLDRSEPGRIASVSLSALIIVAAPALATCMVAAVARLVTRTSARLFYSWSLFVSAVAGVFSYLTAMVSSFQGMEVGLRWMACFFAVQAIVSLILLIVGLTGGIPRTAEEARALHQATLPSASSSTKEKSSSASSTSSDEAATSASAKTPASIGTASPTAGKTATTAQGGEGTHASTSSAKEKETH